MDDEGFLSALRENPNDDVTRLIYADWLQERGDVRGEYLRLEHELSRIPLRLAHLRPQIDPEWLAVASKRRRLVLISFPLERKIELIKVVREITGLGLAEAKKLVETPRATIKDDLTTDEAEQLVERLREIAGVVVEATPQ